MSSTRLDAGFTLIELLVALVISGLFAGILFEFLAGQSRFADLQNARQEVQQNARASVDLITSELRSVEPNGIVSATATAIQFRTPTVWGLACANPADRRVAVIFPALPGDFSVAGDSIAISLPPSGSTSPLWTFSPVLSVTGTDLSSAQTLCRAQLGLDAAAVADIRLYEGSQVHGAGQIPPGTPVYLFSSAHYLVGPADERAWIKRNVGASAPEPMAGPVPSTADPETHGLKFTYFDAAGADLGASPTAADIRRIRVSVRMLSTVTLNGVPQQDFASTDVFLRNGH